MILRTTYSRPSLSFRASFSLPPSVLVLTTISSSQLGAVFAKQLFEVIGYPGTLSVSYVFAAIMFLLWSRPRFRRYTPQELMLAIAMGLVLVGMHFCLYGAFARIPLGIAIAFQFIGPLGMAAVKSHRRLDLVWVFCAAVGITLLSPTGTFNIAPIGIGLAVLSGVLLAAYIELAAKVSDRFEGSDGLALAIATSAVVLLPTNIGASPTLLAHPGLLIAGLGVALLSTVVPCSMDAMVLKQTSPKTLGLLLSLEPAIAALIGWVVLGETLIPRAIVGIILIMIAAAGNAYYESIHPAERPLNLQFEIKP